MIRFRADLRMIAASFGALMINGAATGFAVEVQAIIVRHAGQGKNGGFVVEVVDDARFLQTFGDGLEIALGFKLVH